MRYYLLTSFDHLASTEKPGMLKLKVRCIVNFSRGPGSAVGQKAKNSVKQQKRSASENIAKPSGVLGRFASLAFFFRL